MAGPDPGEALAGIQAESSAGTRFHGKKLKILILLLVIVTAQVGLIYFLVPAPAASGSDVATEPQEPQSAETISAPAPDADTVEVVIDDFNVTNNKASTSSVIHITFKLVAIVSKAAEHDFKKAANEVHRARVRQAVVIVARSSSLADLDDPHLSNLKRQIREEINKVLRKSAVIEVVINDFKTMEQ